jgi:transcriptional regulator with XRE-family HTH domain
MQSGWLIRYAAAMAGLRAQSLARFNAASVVREARLGAGLPQAELAKRVGTTQSAISRWEQGHDEPRLSRLADVLRACGVNATLVFDDHDTVDRAQLRQQLAMTPEQRLASVVNISRMVAGAQRA